MSASWKQTGLKLIRGAALLIAAGPYFTGCRSDMATGRTVAPPTARQTEKEFSDRYEAVPPTTALQALTKAAGTPASTMAGDKHLNVNKLALPTVAGCFLAGDCFVTRWNILGPFLYEPENGPAPSGMVHQPFMPDEKSLTGAERPGGANIGWQLARFESSRHPGEIDLRQIFKGQLQHAAAYAITYLESSVPLSNLTLYVGGSGFIKVWVNQRLVHVYDQTAREGRWDQDAVKGIKLRQGFNQIVVKSLCAGNGDWNFYFRLATENDLPLKVSQE